MGLAETFGGLKRRHNNNSQSSEDADQTEHDPMEESEDEDDISDSGSEDEKKKKKNRRPKVNSFTQQKLRAVHPILTPKNVIPALIAMAVVFVPLGAAMFYGAHKVEQLIIDYSQCENLASYDYYSEVPEKYLKYHFSKEMNVTAQWKLNTNSSSIWDDYPDDRAICQLQFQIPNDIGPSIFFFYMLRNFYPNHRRFASSFSEDQILGKRASISDVKNTEGQNCKPLSVDDATGKLIYPCGLIANSLFNDTYSILNAVNDTTDDYMLYREGIAWGYNKGRFKKTKYSPDEVVPPPNWIKMYPNGYNSTNMPNIADWPELQNWMAPAALTPFSKMVGRNDDDKLTKGTYEVSIGLHFPVLPYDGHKYIYLSTRSVIGGRNTFLGICWMVGGCVCILLAVGFAIVHLVHPRKLGDPSLFSWSEENQAEEAARLNAKVKAATEAAAAADADTRPKESSSSSS
ncbi:hypothetical protein FOA43_001701 [Brettanomyces nanus]|uniref:Uncharacterized protein n=1 Tax=Eeniella nana TaxID=13502 RepID=A0A875S585_EENNA|nr:uncharacterized protein FOA43_001701 [Brettanomyces nanus]QPG74374.1 hypothetical protein FOA43_001701 [Brettanomyces nanus]